MNTENETTCGCRKCNPSAWWMVLCSECGNKRCPHAEDHKFICTHSNELGQVGVVGETVPLPKEREWYTIPTFHARAVYVEGSKELPDGLYSGIWGGNHIYIPLDEKKVEFTSIGFGVKGFNIPVWVAIKDNGTVITFDERKRL